MICNLIVLHNIALYTCDCNVKCPNLCLEVCQHMHRMNTVLAIVINPPLQRVMNSVMKYICIYIGAFIKL